MTRTEEKKIAAELQTIRKLMDRSAKFVALNGLSSVMSGIYALIGGIIALQFLPDQNNITMLCGIGIIILLLSLFTAVGLTIRKARKKEEGVWNPASKRFLVNLFIPLVTGGLFILILLIRGEYSLIAGLCLIFYGLGLVSGSPYTFPDVKWLGLSVIAAGLVAVSVPAYGLLLWTVGFGGLHLVYGTIMHFKYER